MWIEARVTARGRTCPAFQVDERYAPEVCRWSWSVNPNGYIRTHMNGRSVLLARFIWLLHTGAWPAQEIDHVNRDKLDNRVANLRDVSRSVNMKNRVLPALYRLGVAVQKAAAMPTGVTYLRRRVSKPYRARVHSEGKLKHLGCFATPEEAHAAYLSAIEGIRNGTGKTH